jgi:hypothetical protein
MSTLDFALALVAGSVALAAWLDVRLERHRPESPSARIMHAMAAWIALRVTAAVSAGLAGSDGPAVKTLGVLLLVVLPGLVYAFLSGLWLARTLADVARLSRR